MQQVNTEIALTMATRYLVVPGLGRGGFVHAVPDKVGHVPLGHELARVVFIRPQPGE